MLVRVGWMMRSKLSARSLSGGRAGEMTGDDAVTRAVLYHVTTPSACFGFLVWGTTVVECAPYMRAKWVGLELSTIQRQCHERKWHLERLR